jgi:peptidoglycan/LPS O-acetylase OafA/YrhL
VIAIMMRSGGGRFRLARVRSGLVCGLVAVVIICMVSRSESAYSPLMSTLGYSATAGTSAFLLLAVLLWPGRWRLLRWKPLVYTGQIAYGLYLLQGPASWAARTVVGRFFGSRIEGHSALSVPITFVASFAAAALSWRLFESPILNLKDKFTPMTSLAGSTPQEGGPGVLGRYSWRRSAADVHRASRPGAVAT